MIHPREEGDELNFKQAFNGVKKDRGDIDIDKIDLMKLRHFLKHKRAFLVNLLQNPNLLEYEGFTRTLMVIFHITEELAARDLDCLCVEDKDHTREDLERAYYHLTIQLGAVYAVHQGKLQLFLSVCHETSRMRTI